MESGDRPRKEPSASSAMLRHPLATDTDRASTTDNDVAQETAYFERCGSLDYVLSEMKRQGDASRRSAALTGHAGLCRVVDGLCALLWAGLLTGAADNASEESEALAPIVNRELILLAGFSRELVYRGLE